MKIHPDNAFQMLDFVKLRFADRSTMTGVVLPIFCFLVWLKHQWQCSDGSLIAFYFYISDLICSCDDYTRHMYEADLFEVLRFMSCYIKPSTISKCWPHLNLNPPGKIFTTHIDFLVIGFIQCKISKIHIFQMKFIVS